LRCRLARLLLASLARSQLPLRPRVCSTVHLFAFRQVMVCLTLGLPAVYSLTQAADRVAVQSLFCPELRVIVILALSL
jgi:hypothetical protein